MTAGSASGLHSETDPNPLAIYSNQDLQERKAVLESGFFRAKTRSGELDQSLLNSVLNRPRDAILRVRKADRSTEGNKVRLPSALIQPMAADDVASALGRIATSSPVNGTIEI